MSLQIESKELIPYLFLLKARRCAPLGADSLFLLLPATCILKTKLGRARILSLENKFAFESVVHALEGVDNLGSVVVALESVVDALQSVVDAFEIVVDALKRVVDALESFLDEPESVVEALESDDTFQSVDDALESIDDGLASSVHSLEAIGS